MAKIVLVDDHRLLRNGLSSLIKSLGHEVVFEADNGEDFINLLSTNARPDLVLVDINMPIMDGYDTTLWIKTNAPDINVLALSMYDDENAIIRMLKNGAKGYILKDSDPLELEKAILAIIEKGFYYSDLVSGRLVKAVTKNNDTENDGSLLDLSFKEKEFLKFACTELTYKEIADKMFVSPRTIDGYRENICTKLQIKSRIGLVMFAIKHNLVAVK
jgi:DNA-binding NarL/FixJ family response regulator